MNVPTSTTAYLQRTTTSLEGQEYIPSMGRSNVCAFPSNSEPGLLFLAVNETMGDDAETNSASTLLTPAQCEQLALELVKQAAYLRAMGG